MMQWSSDNFLFSFIYFSGFYIELLLFFFFYLMMKRHMTIASFPLTTILYGSAYWKVCE